MEQDQQQQHQHQQQQSSTLMNRYQHQNQNHHSHPQNALQRAFVRDGTDCYWWDSTANIPTDRTSLVNNEGLLSWVGRLLWRLLRLCVLLGMSTVSYAIFYQHAMPRLHSIQELQFDYTGETWKETQLQYSRTRRSRRQMEAYPNLLDDDVFLDNYDDDDDSSPAAEEDRRENEPPTQQIEHRPAFLPLHLVHMHRHETTRQHDQMPTPPVEPQPVIPTAVINLYAGHNNWCAVEPSVLPDPQRPPHRHWQQQQQSLKPKQPYYVDIVLQLPESEANRNAGMFGVVTELYGSINSDSDKHNSTSTASIPITRLAVARRSSRFPHTTPWISTILKIFLLLPILLQALPEARTVTVSAFRQYVDADEHPLVGAEAGILLSCLFFSGRLLTCVSP